VIIVDGHKFWQGFIKKNGEISWRCTVKSCAAKICTDDTCSAVLSGHLEHIHETNAQKLEQQILRTACKRKANGMISERPSKFICSELCKITEDNLENNDLKCVRQSMYRERRKLYPAQPTNQHEFHNILHEIGVRTNKDEDFVLCNDSESDIIILGCKANLLFLCLNSEEIFADGIF